LKRETFDEMLIFGECLLDKSGRLLPDAPSSELTRASARLAAGSARYRSHAALLGRSSSSASSSPDPRHGFGEQGEINRLFDSDFAKRIDRNRRRSTSARQKRKIERRLQCASGWASGTTGANWHCNTMEDRLYRVLLSFGIAGLITTFVVLVFLLFYWAVGRI
jgi:hypothetical protein